MIWPLKFFALICLTGWAGAASAQEPVFFKPLDTHPAKTSILRYLDFIGASQDAGTLMVADADLNDDGLTEALVRYPDSSIRIIALPPRRAAVSLGTLDDARQVQIADQRDFGVRRILTAGSRANDFSRHTYRWNPHAQRYEKTP